MAAKRKEKPPRTPAMERVFAAVQKVTGYTDVQLAAKEGEEADLHARAARKIAMVALMHLCTLTKSEVAMLFDRVKDDAVTARLFVRDKGKCKGTYAEWLDALEKELGIEDGALRKASWAKAA